ncbi:MAG: prolipoprotein diacylglyceryl transferase [Candidatus Omnitrophica bacterium]|nr:prolipoprotein diacylglyceryl transferase [Candidatus Omnitrophota bacterium]
MYPELFQWGSVTIYTYGALFALGVALAAFMATRRAALIQLDAMTVFDLVVWTGLIGIAGARLVYVGENLDYYLSDPLEMFKLWQGGLVFHGGIAASLVYVFVFARKRGKSFLAVLDFLMPYVALAYGIGRIGCFLNGCCYGTPFDGWWAVEYPFLDYPVHPTQIYSAAVGFLLAGFLLRLNLSKSFEGQTSAAYFIFYSAARTAIEFYRGDKVHGVLGFFTEAQIVFLFLLLVSLAVYVFLCLKCGKAPWKS